MMKKVPTLEQFSYEDKHGRSVADKLLRSKGVKRGSKFAVGDGYLNCREFYLQTDGYLVELITYEMKLGNSSITNTTFKTMDEEAYEYIYKAVILGRGHLWKKKPNKN